MCTLKLWCSGTVQRLRSYSPQAKSCRKPPFGSKILLAQSLGYPFTRCLWLPLYRNAEVNSHGKDYVNQKLYKLFTSWPFIEDVAHL